MGDASAIITNWDQLPELLTPDHVRQLCANDDGTPISRKSVFRLVAAGQLPSAAIHHGRIIRWRKVDIRNHLELRMRLR